MGAARRPPGQTLMGRKREDGAGENSRRGRGGRREKVGEKDKGRGRDPRAPEEGGGTETARQNHDRGQA